MTVSELNRVFVGYKDIIYKDRFTHEVIDYNSMNRREKNKFRNRNIYLMYPEEDKMIVTLF